MAASSSPATPLDDAVGAIGVRAHRQRVLPIRSKPRQYYNLLCTAKTVNYRVNGPMYIVYDSSTGLQISYRGEEIYHCDPTHQAMKSVYFIFCLCGKNVQTFKEYLDAHAGEVPDCGPLSPDDSSPTLSPSADWCELNK
jgi:hypothetical protein